MNYRVSPDLPLDPSSQSQQRSNNGGAADPNGNVANGGGGDTDILLERIAALQQVGLNFGAFSCL